MTIEVWHADSLAGPFGQLKRHYETGSRSQEIVTTSGRSQELADRILAGERCDVFAPSDPQVVEAMFGKKIHNEAAATWYIVFSANEMAVITGRRNPCRLTHMTDLARADLRIARVAGTKDLATGRTLEFIRRACAAEGSPEKAERIIDGAREVPTIPAVLSAVTSGSADAGIVYRSAAVTVAAETELLLFPAEVNLSDRIRNAVTIPSTTREAGAALRFIRFLLSGEGRRILEITGQPPLTPPIVAGTVPEEFFNGQP